MATIKLSRPIQSQPQVQAQKAMKHFHRRAALPPQVVLYQVALQAAYLQRCPQVLPAPQAKQQAQSPLR